MIREACERDLQGLLELYVHLHEDKVPESSPALIETWREIMDDRNHHIIVKEMNGIIVSSCVCVVIPNLTRNVRPYALIENVVTHAEHRKKGYASECLRKAVEIARMDNCYKVMLLTGAKDEKTLSFYKNAGFNCTDKTAFVQWIK